MGGVGDFFGTIGGAVVGGPIGALAGSSVDQARAQRASVSEAGQLQLVAQRRAILAQQAAAERGFDIFQQEADRSRQFLSSQTEAARRELAPLREFGLESLQTAREFLDPDSELVQQERAQFQKTLGANLSARGLTASGTEIAGLTDFELGQGRQRRNLSLALLGRSAPAIAQSAALQQQLGQGSAGISSQLGAAGASIFSGAGQNTANIISQGGTNQANLALQQGQITAQNIAQLQNIGQGVFSAGLGFLGQQQALSQNQQLYNRLFPPQQGGGQNLTLGNLPAIGGPLA